jgi:heme-degrading monooxygenase HmoA
VLRPGNPEDPYVILTVWESRADFDAWVNSEAFQKGHAKSRTLPREAFSGHSKLETVEVIFDTAVG